MRVGLMMALALAPTAAAAQDFGSWTGGYIGAGASYIGSSLYFSNCGGLCPSNASLSGLSVIVQGGYDRRLNNGLVAGAYFDVPVTSPAGSFNAGTQVAPRIFDYRPTFTVAAGGRVGYAFGQFLPYVHAGLHVTHVTAQSFAGTTDSNTHLGAQVGAGAELKINRHFSTDFRGTYTNSFPRSYDFGAGGKSQWGQSGVAGTISFKWRFAN